MYDRYDTYDMYDTYVIGHNPDRAVTDSPDCTWNRVNPIWEVREVRPETA